MPFTLSHCAAILPFAGRRLPLSALAIGAMSPDFEYLIRLRAQTEISHTWPGLFTFCLPIGLFVLWIFQRVVKRPLATLLPETLSTRIAAQPCEFPFLPARRFLLLAACIALGAATHIIWDAFTHPHGWGVQAFPILQKTLPIESSQGSPHVYRILQHGSTLLGLALLALATHRWQRRVQATPLKSRQTLTRRLRYSAALLLLPPLLGLAFAALRDGLPQTFFAFRCFAVQAAIAAMSFFCIIAVIAASLLQRLEKPRP